MVDGKIVAARTKNINTIPEEKTEITQVCAIPNLIILSTTPYILIHAMCVDQLSVLKRYLINVHNKCKCTDLVVPWSD